MLTISTLGGLSIRRDGEAVTGLASRKVEALLVYVASADRPQSRDVLAEMLWEERTQRQSLGNLRVALSSLRKELAPYVLITRDTVVMNPEAQVWLDASELEAKLAEAQDPAARITPEMAAQIEEAVGLYQGDFLQGFYVRDSAAFEDWMGRERERFHRLVVGALPRLVAYCLELGDYPGGIRHGSRLVELDPLMEEAHRQMMRLLAYSGQRGAALEQYETCCGILERELGVEPVAETTALYEQIVAGKVGPPAAVLAEEEEIPPAPGEPPFKGLQFFDVGDADLFFGREMLTARLVERLGEERLLAVVGASGSGKSSLVRAGLIPALKRGEPLADGTLPPRGSEGWGMQVLTPTAHPLEALAVSLTRGESSAQATTTLMDDLAADPRSLHIHVRKRITRGNRLLLVVDQFEELFALCRDPDEWGAFVDNLLTAVDPQVGGPTVVVLTLRADFYHHCAQYEKLREALETHQAYIGSMTPEELRRAIEEPAVQNGWEFEPGLVGLLLHDVGGEPGALPLLSHALLETWKRRRGRTMTLAGYTGAGRVQGAIAQSAEAVYRGLKEEERAVARTIFLRLTELGEGTQDTRRQVGMDELVTHPGEATAVEEVLSTLVEARLVTAEEATVQVAHEALIREWPTLREWLEEDREGLRVHRHLTEAAQEWERMGRDPGELYRGGRLAQALEWASAHSEALNPLEREFLAASEEWAQRQEAEREAQRQRELEAARELAEERARSAARLRQSADLATSRELAASALHSLNADPERSILLALYGLSTAHTLDAEYALHQAIQASRVRLTLNSGDRSGWVAYSPDGTRLVSSGEIGAMVWDAGSGQELFTLDTDQWVNRATFSPDGSLIVTPNENPRDPDDDSTIGIWDAESGQELLTFVAHGAYVQDVTFSPDGARFASASGDGTAKVWDLAATLAEGEGAEILTLSGHDEIETVVSVEFSPDGTRLATASKDGTAKVWDAATGQELLTVSSDSGLMLTHAAFSPDGMYLLTIGGEGRVDVWDADSGRKVSKTTAHEFTGQHVVFSPDGTKVATCGIDGTAKVWDFSPEGLQPLITLAGHTDNIQGVDFSPDGRHLVSSGLDGTTRIWDISPTGSQELGVFPHAGGVRSVVFNPEGTRLATAGLDGTANVWDIATGQALFELSGHSDAILGVDFSPDGKLLATSSEDGTAKVWDVEASAASASGQELFTLSGHTRQESGFWKGIMGVAFSPDGERLATAAKDGLVKIWDVSTGGELFVLKGHEDGVNSVAFSPDGRLVVTASDDSTVRVWDAGTGQELWALSTSDTGWSVAFSPDGSRLATRDTGAEIGVWQLPQNLGENPDAVPEELLTFLGNSGSYGRVRFSPDGTRIAAGGTNGLSLWDAESGQLLLHLIDSRATPAAVFSPDGTRLATAHYDGAARLFALDLDELTALARSRLTRALTKQECQRYLHVEECPPLP